MSKDLLCIREPEALRSWRRNACGPEERIALVPTMGALHEGHLSLVEAAKRLGDRCIVSIFVNPAQFGPSEDFDIYPRQLENDLEKLRPLGVDAVFAPDVRHMYPDGFATYVVPEGLSDGLCGATRPGFFRGVCTVVAALFRITQCHCAVFGEKDYQQLQVVRRMVRDLWLDVEVMGMPIVREDDGLAMSSRNRRISPELRGKATVLYRSLLALQAAVASGTSKVSDLKQQAIEILSATPELELDYYEIVDAVNLEPLTQVSSTARAAVAANLGGVRLIDNIALEPKIDG